MDWPAFISQYDLLCERLPDCWQDAMVLGNGTLGGIVYAPDGLRVVLNRGDVIDGRSHEVAQVIPLDEARRMVRDGAGHDEFSAAEWRAGAPAGVGPKSCVQLDMMLGARGFSARPRVQGRLGLHDATCRIAADKHLYHPRLDSFVHAERQLFCMRMADVSPFGDWHTRLFFGRPRDLDHPAATVRREQGRLVMEMAFTGGSRYSAVLTLLPRPSQALRETQERLVRPMYRFPETGEAKFEVVGDHGIVTAGGDFELFIAVVSDRDSDTPTAAAHALLDEATAKGYAKLHTEHAAWWANWWQGPWLEVGNKAREQLYYLSLYALACSYRHAPMAGLIGLFYGPGFGPIQHTPWHGDIHCDLNAQCPVFGVFAAGRPDLADAYIDTFNEWLPSARQAAREVFGKDGAHYGMCYTAHGVPMHGNVGAYRWFLGGSYVAFIHCLAWHYSRDRELLRARVYPLLVEVLDFYLDYAEPGEDGRLHFWPCHAPELNEMDVADAVFTIAPLRTCLETAIEASALLGVDEARRGRWRDLLERLPEYPRDADHAGREVVTDAVGIAGDHQVGQAGCLYPVYPCGEVDAWSPAALRDLYVRTFTSVREKTAETYFSEAEGFHNRTVWGCFFRAMTALRLGLGEEFWRRYLPMFLACYAKPNGLVCHDACRVMDPAASEANLANIPDLSFSNANGRMPAREPFHDRLLTATPDVEAQRHAIPVIEGNGDFVTMITEALLQSQRGVIRVFPGWPRDADAQFHRLLAIGGVEVSAQLREGAVQFLRLARRAGSDATTPVRMQSPWTGEVITLDLPAGQPLWLTADGPAEKLPEPEPASPEDAAIRTLHADEFGETILGKRA